MRKTYLTIIFSLLSFGLIAQDGASPNTGIALLGSGGGGSATSPGGSSGNVQYNNSGAFGGFGDWNGARLSIDNAGNTGTRILSLNTGGVEQAYVTNSGLIVGSSLEITGIGFYDTILNIGAGGSLGFSDGVDFGGAIQRVTGGNGGLKVTDGSSGWNEIQARDIKLVPNAVTQPTCVSGIRGTIWYTSSDTGVPDKIEVCAKSTADAYAWIAMATIP